MQIDTDHPVHAPASSNPWECDFPTDKKYIIQPVRGVFQVYKDKESADNNTPIPYPFPSLDVFVADMHRLCTMIADGPL